MASTTALLPIQSFMPTKTQINGLAVTIGNHPYPQPHRPKANVVFNVITLDGSDRIYGPDGREMAPARISEFVDIYV
jgi:hypothetical protein